jgi:hypothetical protein
LEKGKRISYTIEGPTAYVNPNAIGTVKITVGGAETPTLFGYRVRVWNSGGAPLSSLPILFTFATTNGSFKIFNVTHATVPKREFGKIDEEMPNPFSRRFVYSLMNPKDEDVLTFLTNQDAPLSVYAKAEGLKVQLVEAKEQASRSGIQNYLIVVIGVLSSLFSVVAFWFSERKQLMLARMELKRMQMILEETRHRQERPNKR